MAVQAGRLLHCIADLFNGIGRLIGTVIDLCSGEGMIQHPVLEEAHQLLDIDARLDGVLPAGIKKVALLLPPVQAGHVAVLWIMRAMQTTKNAMSLVMMIIHVGIIVQVVREVMRIAAKIGMAVAARAENAVAVMHITTITVNMAAVMMSVMNHAVGIPLLIYMYALVITEESSMEASRFLSE